MVQLQVLKYQGEVFLQGLYHLSSYLSFFDLMFGSVELETVSFKNFHYMSLKLCDTQGSAVCVKLC